MRAVSPCSDAFHEDNAASSREDLLIPANLAPAEEAALSKVSTPASLEGFVSVAFRATAASRQAQQSLLPASRNSVNTSPWGMPKNTFWSTQGRHRDLFKGHF